MIKSGDEIQWTHKSDTGNKNYPNYDVHLGIVMTRRKNFPPKPSLSFRFTEEGLKKLKSQHVLYAYDEDDCRIFFKGGDPTTGYTIQSNLSITCRVDKRTCDALQKHTGRYTFDRLRDGTLFIQLEEMK